jgi:hypothetical protein
MVRNQIQGNILRSFLAPAPFPAFSAFCWYADLRRPPVQQPRGCSFTPHAVSLLPRSAGAAAAADANEHGNLARESNSCFRLIRPVASASATLSPRGECTSHGYIGS